MIKTEKPVSERALGPLPLVVGITGHRDLRAEDFAALEAQVRDFFVTLQHQYRHTPLVLLSPLAEGADRLAARIALDLNIRLIVPLPFSKELYEEDFESSSSLAEFRNLLQRADHWFELPVLEGASENSLNDTEVRSQQYAYVGAYIVQYSQILLALWDGVSSPMPLGGTASIVQYKLQGVPEQYAPRHGLLDPKEGGPVYHLVTPRKKNPHPQQSFALLKLLPASGNNTEADAVYKQIYERMEQFNHDALKVGHHLVDVQATSRAALFSTAEGQALPVDLSMIRNCYGTADTMASHFQGLTSRALIYLLTLTFLGALFLALRSPLVSFGWANVFYGATLLLAMTVYLWAKRGGFETKYQDYRALAEGLRVQFFWLLADMKDKVPEYYLRIQRNELTWIREALRVWTISVSPGVSNTSDAGESGTPLEEVLVHWVQNQKAYFSRAAQASQQRLKHLRRWASGFFIAGMIWTASGFLLARLYPQGSGLSLLPGGSFLAIALGLTPGVTALLYTYIRISALPEHSKQYGRMSSVFAIAQERLELSLAEKNLAKAEAIIRELGQEALIENGAWLMLHRERLLERPIKGLKK